MSRETPLRAAARLVLSGEEPAIAPGEPTRELLGLLRRNKVVLKSLESAPGVGTAAWTAFSARPEVSRALESERADANELLEDWRRAAAAFGARGIRAVLFKSPRWFPSLSSNLDVLVSPGSFREAARILSDQGHILLPHYREDHKLLFRTFRRGHAALSVHLHEAVSWGKVAILEGGEVVSRSVEGEDDAIRVSSPLDAMITTIAHTVFETDQVRLGDLLILREAIARGGSFEGLLASAAVGRWEAAAAAGLLLYEAVGRAAGAGDLLDAGSRERAEAIVGARSWARRRLDRILAGGVRDLPFLLPRAFSKEHLVRHILGDPQRAPDRKVADLAASAWNLISTRLRVRARPAALITIGGPDGAGKSRLAAAVAGALSLCEVPTRMVWTRGGFSFMAAAGKALARRAAPGALPAAHDEAAKRLFLASRWRRALWIWSLVLEQSVGLQRIRLLRGAGRTIVADRWVHDTLADIAARIPGSGAARLPRAACSLLLGLAPAADLAFHIDLPAEVAWRRKPDGLPIESRERLAAAYGEVLTGAPVERLDGTLPPDDLAQVAVQRALKTCFARFARDPREAVR